MEREILTKEHAQVSMGIRELTPEDWRDYAFLRREMLLSDPEAFPPQAFADLSDPEEKWRERIASGDVILAYDGDTPIGMIRVTYNGETANIWNMYTNADYRGQGLGKKLMTTAMGKIFNSGVRVAELEVEDTQVPARTMYERVFGFREIGRVPEGNGFMITMQKPLTPES